MNSIESLNSLTSKFALEYSNRVREIVQQTEINSYPLPLIFEFMRAKARNLCVEKAIEIKNETVNEIVDREIAKFEQDPEHESFYTLKDLNRVKDCLDQIELHKSPPLPPHNQIRNTPPEGSNFSQTRPAFRSNTPDSTASESSSRSRSISSINNQQRDLLTEQDNTEVQYRPLIPRNRNATTEIDADDQLLINLRTSINNDREEEVNKEELPEEDIPIDTYNKQNFQQFLNYINPLIELNNNPVPEVNNHSDNNSENSDEKMATYLVKPPKFSGTYGEDPLEWLQEFITAAKANA
ncbi:hypothetical protein Glove_372g160 [Diversispora epigaea]|uniref:Uncharacterized protein n=1 Tax=Diversispora epigaea TaxID=1348612 RepID=A0A397HDZ6_9GLOM|nr:hypothetical protein Glove_372g160 [Diversispora epigaea]